MKSLTPIVTSCCCHAPEAVSLGATAQYPSSSRERRWAPPRSERSWLRRASLLYRAALTKSARHLLGLLPRPLPTSAASRWPPGSSPQESVSQVVADLL